MRFVAFEIGNGDVETFNKLLKKFDINKVDIVCADAYKVYRDNMPKYVVSMREDEPKRCINHVISKAETCLVESYNSVLRHYLARLHRKTKCYSKSVDMLRLSIELFFSEWRSPTALY